MKVLILHEGAWRTPHAVASAHLDGRYFDTRIIYVECFCGNWTYSKARDGCTDEQATEIARLLFQTRLNEHVEVLPWS